MFNKSRVISLFVAISFVFVLAGLAAQQTTTEKKAPENTQEVVVCKVCGMKVDKAQNPITWDYKGKTYYFCSQDCKNSFMKDPESFLKEKPAEQAKPCAEAKSSGEAKPCAGMMPHGQMKDQKMMKGEKGMGCGMKMGKMAGCPMMMKDLEIKVENTKDGVTVTMTSKNPETVKMIQDHAAKMKDCCKAKEGCPGAKKEEIKKEPVKK
jgi:YHS domain-containing protein